MPLVIGPGHAQVLIHYHSGTGHACQNVMAYSVVSPLTQADVNDLSALFAVPYKNALNSAGRYDGIRVLEGNDGPLTVWESTSGAGAGLRSATLCAPQVMGLIKKSTAFAGRKFHGRIFIPDQAESEVNDQGNLVGDGLLFLNGIASALFITAGEAFVHAELLHEDGVTAPTPITSMAAESKVATLRRRYDR